MRRAAVSISSNIAEGTSRTSKVDFARFIEIASGSLYEVVSQSFIAKNQGFLSADHALPRSLRRCRRTKSHAQRPQKCPSCQIEALAITRGGSQPSTLNSQRSTPPMPYIDQFFEVLINAGASDLHLGEGQPPKIRRHGDVISIREDLLTHEEMAYMMSEISGPDRWQRATLIPAISTSLTRWMSTRAFVAIFSSRRRALGASSVSSRQRS